MVQTFEFDKNEVRDCILAYLKSKDIQIPAKATLTFDIKVHPTSREMERVKMTARYSEENPISNGAIHD